MELIGIFQRLQLMNPPIVIVSHFCQRPKVWTTLVWEVPYLSFSYHFFEDIEENCGKETLSCWCSFDPMRTNDAENRQRQGHHSYSQNKLSESTLKMAPNLTENKSDCACGCHLFSKSVRLRSSFFIFDARLFLFTSSLNTRFSQMQFCDNFSIIFKRWRNAYWTNKGSTTKIKQRAWSKYSFQIGSTLIWLN